MQKTNYFYIVSILFAFCTVAKGQTINYQDSIKIYLGKNNCEKANDFYNKQISMFPLTEYREEMKAFKVEIEKCNNKKNQKSTEKQQNKQTQQLQKVEKDTVIQNITYDNSTTYNQTGGVNIGNVETLIINPHLDKKKEDKPQETKPLSAVSNYLPNPTISKEQAINIFKDLVRIEPINCVAATFDKKECILCIANKTGVDVNNKMFYSNADIVFYKLRKFANTWRVDIQKPIFTEEFTYSEFYNDFEISTIVNKPYLYFLYESSPMGNAVSYTNLNFSLFSLIDFQLTILDYGGEPVYDSNGNSQHIKGDFTNIDKLSSTPDLLKFLENKASKSSIVYRATNKDLEMNNAINYEKKWQVDNSKIKSVWSTKENTNEEALKITYYSKSIFPTEQNYISGSIENSKFKIVSLFRNNILGYDKIKKKYFPLWVESCSHGCNKDVTFINDTTLRITYSEANEEMIIVDLTNMTYKIILN